MQNRLFTAKMNSDNTFLQNRTTSVHDIARKQALNRARYLSIADALKIRCSLLCQVFSQT